MTRRATKKETGSATPLGKIADALEAEAAVLAKKGKAEKPKTETDAEKIARLEQQLAAVDAERQQAIKIIESFGKEVSILGGKMQACVQQR